MKYKPRSKVDWNTNQRIHKPSKGKGSYQRNPKNKKLDGNKDDC
jgi:hypothetical protein|tara:strand:+ start:1344 stop:1475 length:132 start_codon:yes stop_codon:yes gene_type:complete